MIISFKIYEYVFPLFGGKTKDGNFEPIILCGTVSQISPFLFITAAHSIKSAKTYESCAIGLFSFNTKQFSYYDILDYEYHDGLDLGIITIYPNFVRDFADRFRISREPLSLLDDIFTIGYPHGLDLENGVLINRALKGYVVNHFSFRKLPKAPIVYELSFQCPVGISGAPLLRKNDATSEITVHGYIIGNSSTEIVTFSHKEICVENNKTTILERSETTKFGIAIDSKELELIASEKFGDLSFIFQF